MYKVLTALEKTQQAWEEKFGKNKLNRTPQNWANLVEEYGIEKVAHMEGLTTGQVRKKCKLTFSQQLAQKQREQRLNKC